MKEKKSGKIIYISSVAGEVGGIASEATYAISKAGLICLAKTVAKYLGPYGVNVNAIASGTIQTNMTEVLKNDSNTLSSIPLGKIGNVQDISAAVLYLSSSDSDYVTGSTLDVNGGIFMK